jgi:hypothetical protein
LIINGSDHSLQRGNITGERQYGIALSPKIYSMMSDKLYADRIGSTVREVCSNAWDAQKMQSISSGKPIQAFKVILPTEFEPHFIVEDSGPGMPDEVAQDLYSTIGLSTKENTNDQIGAFGLGSKSPFSVTDTFTVENTYNGTTHYYMCFKTEKGLPSLLKTGERVEDRNNGVRVIIPAPSSKYKEYKNALLRQLIVMEPKPIIDNIEDFSFVEPVKLATNKYGYILSNANEFNLTSRVYARMGMVVYPVDTNQLSLSYNSFHNKIKVGSAVILEFNIGEIEPLPSREGLTYDKFTINNIVEAYNKFSESYKEELLKDVMSCTLPLDAFNKMVNISENTGLDMLTQNIVIGGFPINRNHLMRVFPTFEREIIEPDVVVPEMQLHDGTIRPGNIIKGKTYKKTKGQFNYQEFDSSDLRLNIVRTRECFVDLSFYKLNAIVGNTAKFILYDEVEPKYRISRLKSILNSMKGRSDRVYFVYVNEHFPGDKLDFAEFLSSFEKIHPGITANNFIRLSSVPKPESVKRFDDEDKSNKPIPSISLIANGRVNNYVKPSTLKAIADDITRVEDTFYVRALRNDIIDYDIEIRNFSKSFSDLGFSCIVVKKSAFGRIEYFENLGIVEFKEFINNKLKGLKTSEEFKKKSSALTIADDHYNIFRSYNVHEKIESLRCSLKEDGCFVHPFFDMHEDILRIIKTKDYENTTNEEILVSKIKESKLIKFFKEEEWYKESLSDIDLIPEFNRVYEYFNKCYPLLFSLFNSVDHPERYQYMLDYNRINNLQSQSIDLSEVYNSNII